MHREYLKERERWAQERGLTASQSANPSLPGPVVPTLTDEDTSLGPSHYVGSLVTYSSPWIDLCSPDPHISSISRQVLNLEAAYANFCGARTIVVPGPRQDESGRAVAQYARAIKEAMQIANRANIVIHMPMYREPGLEEKAETLSDIFHPENKPDPGAKKAIDLFSSWDSWNTIRSVCNYSMRLFVGRLALGPLLASSRTPSRIAMLTPSWLFEFPAVSPKRTFRNDGSPSLCIS